MPAVGRWKPQRTFTSVVLPAPFGPIRPRISPCAERDVDAVERLHALEVNGDAERLEAHGPSALREPDPGGGGQGASGGRGDVRASWPGLRLRERQTVSTTPRSWHLMP